MTGLMPTSPAEAVANGAQLLDEKHPGWWRSIDLDTLDLANCTECICGQLAYTAYAHLKEDEFAIINLSTDRYLNYVNRLFGSRFKYAFAKNNRRKDVVYGFNVPDHTMSFPWDYDDLEKEWKTAIVSRLLADRVEIVTATREVECALT